MTSLRRRRDWNISTRPGLAIGWANNGSLPLFVSCVFEQQPLQSCAPILRPDIQIICRSSFEQSLSALHRAGADIVMSYASMGSNALFNLLQRSDLLMIAEGLDVFKTPIPKELEGKTIAEANIRHRTTCSIIGIDSDGKTMTNPGPDSVLPANGELVLVGTPTGESELLKIFQSK